MSALDALYGEGATAAFTAACSTQALWPASRVAVTQAAQQGSVHVEVVWSLEGERFARASEDCYPARVHYGALEVAPAFRGKGLYRQLVVALTPLYAQWGVRALTACPLGERSEWLLALAGFHRLQWQGQRYFACRLDIACRVSEWREWQEAGAPAASEPAWHKTLREREVPGEGLY